MNPSPNKRYLIGPEDELRAMFPGYAGNDERTLPDGTLLIEVNCTPEQLEVVAACDSIEAFTHPEILDYLRQFEPFADQPEDKAV